MRSNPFLALILLGLWAMTMACPQPQTGGDDDDAAVDDDDDDASGPTMYEDLPCTDWYYDVWEIDVTAGQELKVIVDTVSAATTFDPVVLLSYEQGPIFVDYEFWISDTIPCSFEPPNGALCPLLEWTTTEAGTLAVIVDVAEFPCADKNLAEYRLDISLDGEAVTPTFAFDDYLDF